MEESNCERDHQAHTQADSTPGYCRVPVLRFRGFTYAWERRKFSDLYVVNNERNANCEYGYDRTLSIATMTFNGGNGAADGSLGNYKVIRVGDIAFEGHTNKAHAYGRFVLNDAGDGLMSPRFSCLRPIVKQRYSFWKYYIPHEETMRPILVNATKSGTMMNELVPDDLMCQSISVPCLAEQEVIGGSLTQLDRLVALHQRKLTKLHHIKKALLEKMFPTPGSNIPEIRFQGFTETWKQQQLGEVAEINGGNAWKSGDYSKDGNCLVVTIANVQGNPYIDDSIGNHIDIKGTTPFDLTQDDILISLTGNVGRVSRMTSSKAVLNQRVGKVISKELINDEYLFQIMRTDSFLDAMVSTGQGAAQMNISNSDVLNYQFKVPALKEQKSLSILLRNLDHLATLYQHKLNKLHCIKKALLEKMFV